jgi:hypothetical protein
VVDDIKQVLLEPVRWDVLGMDWVLVGIVRTEPDYLARMLAVRPWTERMSTYQETDSDLVGMSVW